MSEILQFIEKAGPVIYIIFAASVVGVACILYCLMVLRRAVVLPPQLLAIADMPDDEERIAQAVEQCRQEGGPFAEILLTVIATRASSRQEAESLVESAGHRAVHDLGRGPLALEVIAAISPLLGLLGTVLGMHKVFAQISQTGVKEIGTLSGGISEALLTTICGLIVAIPAYVASIWFSRYVESLVLEMERAAVRLMGRLRTDAAPDAAE